MHPTRLLFLALATAFCFAQSVFASEPMLAGFVAAMLVMVAKQGFPGGASTYRRIGGMRQSRAR